MGKEKEMVDVWESISFKLWSRIGPPWRPAKKDINFWEKRLNRLAKNKKIKVLVLGSTPEIRDMLVKNKINTTLLEANKSMYNAMNRLMKIKSTKEKLVIGNWLEANKIFKENTFDVVISDEPHCNIDYPKWPSFFSSLYNVLKPGGYLMLATVTYNFSQRQTIKEMLKKYKKNKKYFKDFKNRIWELYHLIGEKGVISKDYKLNFDKLRELIKKQALSQFAPEEVDKCLWFVSGDLDGECLGGVTEVGPPLKKQISLQSKWFLLEDMLLIKDHPVFDIKRTMILKSKK
ncbi:MAG TPA: class I SAM-dependent methyltransferase [Patescibacteria group bacterium]|nr:class I SAM-dependent methyltransferase [Patescibacteria group bacterium]